VLCQVQVRGREQQPDLSERAAIVFMYTAVYSCRSELRINYSPGYRVYYQQRGFVIALLLCGGDKHSQGADIKRAIGLASSWKDPMRKVPRKKG
jgi:putative addiction module killer protein